MKHGKLLGLAFGMVVISVVLVLHAGADEGTGFHEYASRMVGGTWTTTDADGKKPEHVYQWVLGQRFILFVDKTAEKPMCAIIGDDPATGKRTWWVFRGDGRVGLVAISTEEKEPGVFYHTMESPGGTSSGEGTTKFVGDDRLEIDSTRIVDGESIHRSEVWERQPGEVAFPDLASEAPAEIPAGLRVLAKLNSNVVVDSQDSHGRKLVGAAVNKWILDGKFFCHSAGFVFESQATGSYLAIIGVDPQTNSCKGFEFGSDGGVGEYILAEDGESVKGRYTSGTGEVMTYEGDFRVEADGTIHYEAQGKVGDEVTPYYVDYRKMPAQ